MCMPLMLYDESLISPLKFIENGQIQCGGASWRNYLLAPIRDKDTHIENLHNASLGFPP
jgi:hypothetical protein